MLRKEEIDIHLSERLGEGTREPEEHQGASGSGWHRRKALPVLELTDSDMRQTAKHWTISASNNEG